VLSVGLSTAVTTFRGHLIKPGNEAMQGSCSHPLSLALLLTAQRCQALDELRVLRLLQHRELLRVDVRFVDLNLIYLSLQVLSVVTLPKCEVASVRARREVNSLILPGFTSLHSLDLEFFEIFVANNTGFQVDIGGLLNRCLCLRLLGCALSRRHLRFILAKALLEPVTYIREPL